MHFRRNRENARYWMEVLTPHGKVLSEKAFKSINPRDYSITIKWNMPMMAWVLFGWCSCGIPNTDGIPCHHMVVEVESREIPQLHCCHRPWLIGGNHLSLKLAIRWSANRQCELARVGTPPKSSDLLQRKKQLLDSSTWLETTTYYARFLRGTNRHLNRWDILHLKRYHTQNQWEYTNAHE